MTNAGDIKEISARILRETGKVMIGKENQIKLVVMAVFAGGHVLFDDLPGVGKTTMVKTLARALDCRFSRVQFTPDLLPSDIVGMNVFNQKTGDFENRPGPVMTNIFLADEINRAIPRTQSALLEAMEELQVTIDGKTYPLPRPFLVMATQNPVEMESTFRLPIAQMDRFLLRISLGYPDHGEELRMLETVGDEIPFDKVEPAADAGKITAIQKELQEVHMDGKVLDYLVRIVEATRNHQDLQLPAGPRGSRCLYRASKVWAAMEGRDFVTPDDIKYIAPHVLPHRIALTAKARLGGRSAGELIRDILEATPAPPSNEEMLGGD